MATTENTAFNPYETRDCCFCGYNTYPDYMTEREGEWWCEKCAALPPYSDTLYSAIVAFQSLFRTYREKKAKPCGSCGNPSLHLWDFIVNMPPICSSCMEMEIQVMREAEEDQDHSCSYCNMDPCRCEDAGPCEDCGNPWECVCLEQAEDAALKRHRRVCGDKTCDGTCGTLPCGCIDVCRCEDAW